MILPFGLQQEVLRHLKVFLSKQATNNSSFSDKYLCRSGNEESCTIDKEHYVQKQQPFSSNNVAMEKILYRRSLQLRNKQQEWQVCPYILHKAGSDVILKRQVNLKCFQPFYF